MEDSSNDELAKELLNANEVALEEEKESPEEEKKETKESEKKEY